MENARDVTSYLRERTEEARAGAGPVTPAAPATAFGESGPGPREENHHFTAPAANGSGGKARTHGSTTSTHSFLQAGRPAADRAPGPDAVPGAAVSPRRAAPGHEPGVSSQTADDVSLRLGGGHRGTRRSHGTGTGRTATAAEQLARQLAPQAGAGPELRVGRNPPAGTPKARVRSTTYEIPVPPDAAPSRPSGSTGCWPTASPAPAADGAGPRRPLRRFLEELTLREGVLHMRLRASRQRSAGPRDVLAALGPGRPGAGGSSPDAHRRGVGAVSHRRPSRPRSVRRRPANACSPTLPNKKAQP